MSTTTDPGGEPVMPAFVRAYVKIMDRLASYVGLAAMYLIFLMIGVLLLDVVSDKVFDTPLHWCVEAAQFTLAAYYFAGGAMTLKNNSHVRMDLLYENLSPRGKARMDLITIGCLIFYLIVLLWGAVSSLEYALQTNERRFSMWNPSMIPIKALMVGCLVLMLLQAFSLVFKHWATLRGKAIA